MKLFFMFCFVFMMMNSINIEAGAIDKKLPLCNNSPNCVSSQAKIADKQHYIAPLEIKGDPENAWSSLKEVIKKQKRMVITHESHETLHAEATSLVMRFVDDINAILDRHAGLIHIRSASRVGHSDFGVNRKRIETIRSELEKLNVIE
ncbi:MAG: DUF1499 domain-containing protein [Methylovulum sp.]|jgi:uncharacterized protein (DUF1499 family)|nr:DUF1499 domain-containing protein [Methylovulum sp.]MCF8000025.1 DUF1499 domain-containing protein [Methylovulum sp.]